jgi:hypothetical protein
MIEEEDMSTINGNTHKRCYVLRLSCLPQENGQTCEHAKRKKENMQTKSHTRMCSVYVTSILQQHLYIFLFLMDKMCKPIKFF